MMRAAMSMQEAEVAPTARQIQACADAQDQFDEVMAKWEALKAGRM